jgi:hypothetical protein
MTFQKLLQQQCGVCVFKMMEKILLLTRDVLQVAPLS